MVSERSQTQMTSYCMIAFMCNSRKNCSDGKQISGGRGGWVGNMFKGKRKDILIFWLMQWTFYFEGIES